MFVSKQVSLGEIISFCVRLTLVLVRVGVSNTFICVSAASLRVVRCEHTHTHVLVIWVAFTRKTIHTCFYVIPAVSVAAAAAAAAAAVAIANVRTAVLGAVLEKITHKVMTLRAAYTPLNRPHLKAPG